MGLCAKLRQVALEMPDRLDLWCPLCKKRLWAGEPVVKQDGAHAKCVANQPLTTN